jgi:flagellar M-ring protein FliF
MNPEQLLARLKSIAAAFSPTQLITIGVTFLAVVGLVSGSAWWLSQPSFALLFADMDPDAAADVVAKLDAQKIAYRLDPGGRGIRVPASQIDKLRLELSAQGMPSSGRIGFEIFDRTAFGATEFLEHVNYRRALEGEIARTIATLAEVSSARVHIAMAKESLFGAKEQPAKASVILKLRSNRPLASATVLGITNLVAASVEGLRADGVVVLDSFGRPLARPPLSDDDTPLGAAEGERQQQMEHELAARVVTLLEPVVGQNRVRANVAVRLTADSEEQTEEKWDPNATVIRSRQQTSDLTPGAGGLGGVSGARANLPPTQPAAGATAGPSKSAAATNAAAAGTTAAAAATPPLPANVASRTTETTNYEISRTTRHTLRPRGTVARLSVAVVVDDELVVKKGKDGALQTSSKPRTPGELQKVQGLIAAAVGIDTTRGDQITVENIAFEAPPVEEPVAPTFFERYEDTLQDGGRMLTTVAVVVLLIFFVLRPLVGRVVSAGARGTPRALPAGAAGQLADGSQSYRTVQDMEGEIEAQLNAAAQAKTIEGLRVPVLAKKANSMIQNEPENAARLLRAWLSEEEG